MQISSVNQSMLYPKTRQVEGVGNFNRNNQPSFGKLLNLEHHFDNLWVLSDKVKGKTLCAELIDGVLSSDSVKSFFRLFDSDMYVGDMRNHHNLQFWAAVAPKKYLGADDCTARFLQKYKDAGVKPDEKLISPMPKDYFKIEKVVGDMMGDKLVPSHFYVNKLVEDPEPVSDFVSAIANRFKNLKEYYVQQHNAFINSRLRDIDDDIANKLRMKSYSRQLGKDVTSDNIIDGLVKFHQDNFNSTL